MTDEALPQAINDLRDCWIWTPDRDPNRLTGSPKVDLERCRASVAMDTRWPRWHQCQKKAKVWYEVFERDEKRQSLGKCGFCTTHDPIKVKERRIAREKRESASWDLRMNELKYRTAGPAFADALRQIANGHNDPRTLAKLTLEKLKESLE